MESDVKILGRFSCTAAQEWPRMRVNVRPSSVIRIFIHNFFYFDQLCPFLTPPLFKFRFVFPTITYFSPFFCLVVSYV